MGEIDAFTSAGISFVLLLLPYFSSLVIYTHKKRYST